MALNEGELLRVFQTIIDNLPSGVTLMDRDLRFVAWNSEIKELLNFPDELFDPDDPPHLSKVALFNAQRGEYGPGDPDEQARALVERAGKMLPHVFERTRPDGTVLEIRGRPLPNGGFVSIYTDMTERKRAEEEVRRTASFLQAVLDHLPFGMMVVDKAIRCRYWNRQSEALFDLPPGFVRQGIAMEEVLRQIARNGIYGPGDVEDHVARRLKIIGGFQAHAFELTRPDGRSLRIMGAPVMIEGEAEGLVLLQEDITEHKNYQATLERLATTDHLTGLLNRRAFLDATEREIRRAHRYGQPLALIMLDVDHFKRINDSHGHPAGDEVLRRIAATCRGMLRDGDLMGRLGGEEFAITLVQPPLQVASAVAERLRKAVSELGIEFGGERLAVTISLGIAEVGDGIVSLDHLVSKADACLYTAKREGRNRACVAGAAPPPGPA
ncbi:MAG: PAS-domain containing protein [Rhodocyclaceae bacterium]|nr:PAS-domain containing protein [Rhodocyclaceae bacterium]